jgi:hypothetical protein
MFRLSSTASFFFKMFPKTIWFFLDYEDRVKRNPIGLKANILFIRRQVPYSNSLAEKSGFSLADASGWYAMDTNPKRKRGASGKA